MKYLPETYTLPNGISCRYQKPNLCPHCGIAVDAKTEFMPVSHNYYAAFYTCTYAHCGKLFFCVYLFSNNGFRLVCSYPQGADVVLEKDFSEHIRSLSPGFIEMYSQAFRAESNGDMMLAASGYRCALERLIKDYAIKYSGETALESLHNKSLNECIESYLDGFDETVSAYLIKVFGEDVTRYPPLPNREFNFNALEKCLNAFIRQMEAKLILLDHIEAPLSSSNGNRTFQDSQRVPGGFNSADNGNMDSLRMMLRKLDEGA